MKNVDILFISFLAIIISVQIGVTGHFLTKEIKQSKQHHENYHKLLKENYRLNEWYQNHECDVSYEPCEVVVECEMK